MSRAARRRSRRTLQQSLAARLDRLGPAREIREIGAVLGRNFPHALLQAVADLDEAELWSALERLAEADILFIEGDGPRANYRFKHALIQDAAYESLLNEPPPGAAPARRRTPARQPRACGGGAGGDRPTFHRGRPR